MQSGPKTACEPTDTRLDPEAGKALLGSLDSLEVVALHCCLLVRSAIVGECGAVTCLLGQALGLLREGPCIAERISQAHRL